MRSNLFLCLLLHICYSATVKAFPASPPVRTLASAPSNLWERADTKFVTVYGFDNSLRNPALDTSKPQLAPITEAFMAMTRALATATVTGSGSGSVKPSAMPTPLHKVTPPSLGKGLVVPPTPVQSSIASTSTDTPQDTLDDFQRGARLRTHRLVVFGSVIAGVIFLALLLFFLLDPRMIRKLCGKKVDNNLPVSSKKFMRRPVPAWNTSPISSADFVFMDDATEKAAFPKHDPGNIIPETWPKQPISKFSICSSEYPPSFASDSEPDPGTPKSETRPVRPPRPPTADSPALTESVYLACADQPYIIVAPQPFTDNDVSLDRPPAIPTGQEILTPREFLDMYAIRPEPTTTGGPNLYKPLSHLQPNTTPEIYDTRHSRNHSAPMLVGSMNDEISKIPEPRVVQRMLKHRRSRSASGWAYPNGPPSKGQHNQPFSLSLR
ncbi:hypothetical protein BYT27DRAFT_7219637 [Phlegmacium glaucopus]|nr:hypothetical protein BYT27DRAFT_7219637 [Phlegmacium glaucopus]